MELGYEDQASAGSAAAAGAAAGSTDNFLLSPLCFNCGNAKESKQLKCAKCRVAGYCQKECQVKDWKKGGHKVYCDAYRRVGPLMKIGTDSEKLDARTEIFARIRYYACPYAVHKFQALGRGFLFIQSNSTLAACSLPLPKDSSGRIMAPERSLLIHYLTLGEYDSEVCRDDFELAIVRPHLKEAVDSYDEEKQIVILTRFRCGNLAVGITPIVPDFAVCRKLGHDYFSESTAGALQLNLDDI